MLYNIGMKYTGDEVDLTILRNKEVIQLKSILHRVRSLVPKLHSFDSFASYFIIGGLVFVPLSVSSITFLIHIQKTCGLVLTGTLF